MTTTTTHESRCKRSGMWGTFGTLQQAKEHAGLIEWYNFQDHLGRSLPNVVLLGDKTALAENSNCPVFISDNGWMYIGGWTERKQGDLFEDGFGISCSCVKGGSYEGLVYIGDCKAGERHGEGKLMWLPTSQVWQSNRVKYSPLRDPATGECIPFNYEGPFHYGDYDGLATVELKDGTRRRGEWKKGEPVGDFFRNHVIVE